MKKSNLKKCYGKMDMLNNNCNGCNQAPNCLIRTVIKRYQRLQLQDIKLIPLKSTFVVRDDDNYELEEGEFVKLIQELEGVAVVENISDGSQHLVRINDLARVYEVADLSYESENFKIETYTDKYRQVYVALSVKGYSGEGIAVCNLNLDKFDILHGYHLAKTRAHMQILKQIESELVCN